MTIASGTDLVVTWTSTEAPISLIRSGPVNCTHTGAAVPPAEKLGEIDQTRAG